jgi:urease beta subunit
MAGRTSPGAEELRPANYREESELRERVGGDLDWSAVTPLSRRAFLATYFPRHPRLHIVLDTFQDYRVAFFRQPHRIDHHCHLQTLHVQGGHLRQILGFLAGLAKYRRLGGTQAWERLRRVPDVVHEMQLCGADAREIYAEILDRHVLPFLRDTGTHANLYRLVMQTHYSDHNHVTPRDEIEETKRMLEGLVEYVYLPQAVELDVWSEDLLSDVRRAGLGEFGLSRVRPKRQLIVAAIDGRVRPETVQALEAYAAHTEALRTGQLLELSRRLRDDAFFAEVLRRYGLALDHDVADFVRRWNDVFLAYYDDEHLRAALNPRTISNKALELFVVAMADRAALDEGWPPSRLERFKEQLEAFLPKAKSLMKDQYEVSRQYPPYLEILRRFGDECLVVEAHPAAQHFVTGTLSNRELFDIMLPVFRCAATHGLTGVEINRGEEFNEVVLEVAERCDLHLTIASDFHALSLARAARLRADREYGCARNIPAVLFRFPGASDPVTLTPLEVARDIGHYTGQPIPDETWRFGHRRRPRTLATLEVVAERGSGPQRIPTALSIARWLRQPFPLPADLEERTWALVRRVEERLAGETGVAGGELSWLVEFVLLTQDPVGAAEGPPREVAVTNSLWHGGRALELLMETVEPEPPLPVVIGVLLHDVARAYGQRDDRDYDDDYGAYKDREQRRSAELSRRLLSDVLFPFELYEPVLFLVAHHERGSHVRERAILRSNLGAPPAEVARWCRLVDLADAFVFFEPESVERYLRRRGRDRLLRKVAWTLDLDPADRDLVRGRVARLRAAGAYAPAAAAVLDETVGGGTN